jgi:hypothetical protein
VRGYLGAQRIAEQIEQGDVVEYWKSAPYLFNFMDSYALKQAFVAEAGTREMVRFVREFPEAFLNLERARTYQSMEPGNPRLRGLLAETVDRGMWRLLWMAPSLGYYAPAGPYAAPDLVGVTKRLVFSAWHMVPRAVASLVSYEAERKMMRSTDPRAKITQEDWKKQRGLLRFNISAERLTGMPLLLLVYPCLTFARYCDPRELARGVLPSAAEVRTLLAEKIKALVDKLRVTYEKTGAADERWYWLAPLLLDFGEFPGAAQAWWGRTDLADKWLGSELLEEYAGWARHVDEAVKMVRVIREGEPSAELFDSSRDAGRGSSLGKR